MFSTRSMCWYAPFLNIAYINVHRNHNRRTLMFPVSRMRCSVVRGREWCVVCRTEDFPIAARIAGPRHLAIITAYRDITITIAILPTARPKAIATIQPLIWSMQRMKYIALIIVLQQRQYCDIRHPRHKESGFLLGRKPGLRGLPSTSTSTSHPNL